MHKAIPDINDAGVDFASSTSWMHSARFDSPSQRFRFSSAKLDSMGSLITYFDH